MRRTIGKARELDKDGSAPTWVPLSRLCVAALAAQMFKVTGQQGRAERYPHEDGTDFLGFEIVLQSPRGAAVTEFLTEEDSPYAKRTLTVPEMLATLLDEDYAGDEYAAQELEKLLGPDLPSVRQWFRAAVAEDTRYGR
jgi:hypothetical protein